MCPHGKVEDSILAFNELSKYPSLVWTSIGIIISIGAFNATGVAVTKNASAAQRSTIDTSRTLLIWLISLMIGWENFYWQQLIGFLLLVMGTLVYNEIVILPWEPFSKNTKVNILKREGKKSITKEGENPEYMGVSPHAGYDANRYKRNIESKTNERYERLAGFGEKAKE